MVKKLISSYTLTSLLIILLLLRLSWNYFAANISIHDGIIVIMISIMLLFLENYISNKLINSLIKLVFVFIFLWYLLVILLLGGAVVPSVVDYSFYLSILIVDLVGLIISIMKFIKKNK